jgi:hypothetical protein
MAMFEHVCGAPGLLSQLIAEREESRIVRLIFADACVAGDEFNMSALVWWIEG